ncbi:MAG TPA: SRPBCC domain-containing protein [Bacteroidia bacterium]|jgi:hypothetical protein|nr:SRPBCC domain-containing protein [Bacteroidia bacterium]
MKTQSFTTTLEVKQSAHEVFDAICNVKGWWQGVIKGKSKKLGDEFTYNMKPFHYSKQKLVEVVPDKKIVWLVTDSKLNFIEDKEEWTGTKISFEISEKNGKTKLVFTHHGLAPKIECYEACSGGWTMLIQKSLLSLITTGKGKKVF